MLSSHSQPRHLVDNKSHQFGPDRLKVVLVDDSVCGVEGDKSMEAQRSRPRLKILWLARLDYYMAEAHGGNLRFFNYGKKLVSAGHDVYFLVRKRGSDDPVEKESHLNALKQQKIITDYFEIEYDRPKLRGKDRKSVV